LVPAKPNTDPDVLTIKFEISDTGKGFDESERAVMFKPFSQVDTSSTRKHGGTGLGLVLSKEFVELHGGKIACESVKGEGSKFSFTFVARVPPPNVTARATTPIASEDIRVNGLMQNFNKAAFKAARLPSGSGSGSGAGSGVGSGVGSFAGKPPLMKDSKRVSDPTLLKHVTGLKLIPGEMCFAEPDFESTKKMATKALESATKKIKRGDFLTADSTLAIDEEELSEQSSAQTAADSTNTTTESPPGDVATAMTRTESILDDRRYLKVGQLTPSNPPMGEPPAVAVIAASLPNPAMDMKLAIPAKVLENKALVAENRKANAALTSAIRPDVLPNSESSSSSSSSSSSAGSSIEAKQSTSTANSSVGSLTDTASVIGSTTVSHGPGQARILVVADLPHARETILHLIKQLVPKKLNPLIDVATDLKEGVEFLVGGRKIATKTGKYNYLVVNLASYMSVMDIFSAMQQDGVLVEPNVVTCVITTPIQRAAVMEAVKVEEASMEIAKSSLEATMPKVIPSNIEWVFKPLTKAKLHVAFADIVSHQETLVSPNGTIGGGLGGVVGNGKMSVKRRTAQQVVVNQKEIFSQMHDAMEGKNIRILLAEDDLTNQKVIRRYFQMVGAELAIANDGNECLDKFKGHPKGHFSLILVSIFSSMRYGTMFAFSLSQHE
jgi:CheY-like chemotaxis protein